ncbi:FAD-dependent monooxygenase [Streptomyces sp. H34-S4]|uniref:FAD-dependent monooxygenase n=1 Tax=Streptomyces sp. H34-S4 TaxID=2996463 RepID=UPI00226F722A|nr:FAD-dependent monooxygenase [Streptomyces sp. H34-S4]MCY0935085.1 FAD-dependent monooxygenase [Streptomyces sp. H34-S4]
MQAQVAVVGGGPVGMLVAAELAGYGVDTVLLEPKSRVSERPKATTLHARAVQGLARRGHVPRPVAPYDGEVAGLPFHFAGLPGLVITAPAGEPEPILKLPQAELERLFELRARAAGARILRGHRVTEVRQEPTWAGPGPGYEPGDGDLGGGGVQVMAEGPDGLVSVDARYVVGADGARSTVREQVGIACDTHPATVSALMGTVTLTEPAALSGGWHQTARGWIVVKHAPGGVTHLRTLNCAGAHSGRHLPVTLDELCREVSWIAGREIAMEAPCWLSRFSDFSRLARSFRAGRVFLVGDAAHVHFPIGGQGLSAGVRDALNLGWKLALAVHGSAGAALLDTYDLECRPVARRVIDNTRAQLALMRPGPELDALRGVFTGMLAAGRDHGHLSDMISAQDTVLPEHTGCPSPGAGRFLRNAVLTTGAGETDVIGLLQEGRPLLLLFGDKGERHRDAARDWAGILRVVRVQPTPDVPYDALLVRPDGYIAWAPGGENLATVLSVYFTGGTRAGAPVTAAGGGHARPVS